MTLHMTGTIAGISSMATRQLLTDLSRWFEQLAPWRVEFESMGGVDAARLVRGGTPTDVVVLASNVMEQLENEGWIAPGTRADIARSGVAIAVRSGLPHPAIASENDVKQAVLEGGKICYSTGPSGEYLKRLFERWKIAGRIADRTVEAKPGVPVGQLVARGEADLGFQQLSEFLDVAGIDIVGPLPADYPNADGLHRRRQLASAAAGRRAGFRRTSRLARDAGRSKQQLGMEAAESSFRVAFAVSVTRGRPRRAAARGCSGAHRT